MLPGPLDPDPEELSPPAEKKRKRKKEKHQKSESPTTRLIIAFIGDGTEPSTKPKVADYVSEASPVLLLACHIYEALVVTEFFFPGVLYQNIKAKEAFEVACRDCHQDYVLTDHIFRMVSLLQTRF